MWGRLRGLVDKHCLQFCKIIRSRLTFECIEAYIGIVPMLQSLLRGTSMPRSGTKALLCVLRVHGSKGKKWRAWWHHHGGQVRRLGGYPAAAGRLMILVTPFVSSMTDMPSTVTLRAQANDESPHWQCCSTQTGERRIPGGSRGSMRERVPRRTG